MDPDLARVWMQEGTLPNLAALAARGGFHRLRTIAVPECETAWASFAAGREVTKPSVAYEPARLLFNFLPVAEEQWRVTPRADSLWSTAGVAGVRTSVLAVPATFPPEPVPNGELLAGMPLPDVRRTRGTYHYFSSTLAAADEGTTANGGILRRLEFERRVARQRVAGPTHPVTGEELSIPLTVTWNHEARSVNVQLGEHAVHLREREWSRWLPIHFTVNSVSRVHGFTQLFLKSAGTELQLYVSPVHWRPDDAPAAISAPRGFARELYHRLGLFGTLGWNAATAALNDERLDEAAFLDDADRAFQDRAETILNRVDAGEWDLLIGVVDTPDRVQHMMWRLMDSEHPRFDAELARRYRASIEQSYQQADALLGDIRSRVGEDAIVLVVSDHGFHTVRSAAKWSGDHTDGGGETLAGLLVSSVPLTMAAPSLIDLAPTILRHFGVAAPPGMQGKALF